jgi:hypothetical protein
MSLKVLKLLFKHYFDYFGEKDLNVCMNCFEQILRSLQTSMECSTIFFLPHITSLLSPLSSLLSHLSSLTSPLSPLLSLLSRLSPLASQIS